MFAFLDQWADPVDLPAALHLVADAFDDAQPLAVGEELGDDGRAAWRQFVDGADGQVGVVAHRQGARDGRGAHHQQVRLQLLAFQLFAQRQPLRHAEAVLLVDDGQPQPREGHVALDDGVRAHHQHGCAAGHLFDHRGARTALAAAGQPGHGHAQRLQPLDELAEMLLGQDLGGRHQRALPAGVHGHRRRQRRHHRLARAHVALQQAVHGDGPGDVGFNFGHHALLGAGQLEGQRGQQLHGQAVSRGLQRGRGQRGAFGLRLQLRNLLGQQFFELQALPGRVAVVFQRCHGLVGARLVQQAQGLAQRRQTGRHHAIGQQLVQRCARQARGHGLAQIGLRQLRRSRVDGRQRTRQRGVGADRAAFGVHHLAAEEAGTHLAARAHQSAGGQRFLLRRVEVQEAQHQFAAVVGQAHHQLAAAARFDAAVQHLALHLRRLAVAHPADGRDARFIHVAHGQVQRQVDVALQPQFLHGLGRARQLHGRLGGRRNCRRRRRCRGFGGLGGRFGEGHGTILTFAGAHPPAALPCTPT